MTPYPQAVIDAGNKALLAALKESDPGCYMDGVENVPDVIIDGHFDISLAVQRVYEAMSAAMEEYEAAMLMEPYSHVAYWPAGEELQIYLIRETKRLPDQGPPE